MDRPDEEPSGEVDEAGGLFRAMTRGLTTYLLRMLCENPWNGGGGHSPLDVAGWSPDQCWFRLCDREWIKSAHGRTRTMGAEQAAAYVQEDGTIKGRAADGTPIRGKIVGKSLARQLMEAERRKQEEATMPKKGRRRRRRGT